MYLYECRFPVTCLNLPINTTSLRTKLTIFIIVDIAAHGVVFPPERVTGLEKPPHAHLIDFITPHKVYGMHIGLHVVDDLTHNAG